MIIHQGFDVFVEDFLLLIRQGFELGEGGFDLFIGQGVWLAAKGTLKLSGHSPPEEWSEEFTGVGRGGQICDEISAQSAESLFATYQTTINS